MSAASFRRATGVLAALLALGFAPFGTIGRAGAAVADSSVSITDATGDTVRGGTSVSEPKADIVAASVRNQNDFISLTMKLAKGDDLSGTAANDYVRWAIGVHENTAPDYIVQLKRGANGFGEVVVFVPGNDPILCPSAVGSFDGVNGLYLASVPLNCVGMLTSFQWAAQRSVAPPSGGLASGPIIDSAPDDGLGKAVSASPVVGYWAIGSDGKVYNFGDAPKLGEPSSPGNLIIDIEAAPHGSGYWTLDSNGTVSAFGPVFYGSVSATDLKAGEKAVSMSATRTGAGYWIFTNKGRMFAFGDANPNLGDLSAIKLNGDVVDSSPTPSGKGYYLTAADGGVFAFKAGFKGSMGSIPLNKPMRGMVPYGNGYLMVAEDGGVFNFSDKPFSGSTGSNPPANPMMSITVFE